MLITPEDALRRKSAMYFKILEKFNLFKDMFMGKHHYDLPLNKDADSKFMITLIALMSFLAILAFTGSFALGSMTARWSSGLENKVTIEIPVETKDGNLLSQETVKQETLRVYKALQDDPLIKTIRILGDEDIGKLIEPWIGDNMTLGEIPLPGLLAVEIKNSDTKSMESLEKNMKAASQHAILENHHEWLHDLMRFATILKVLALGIAALIAGTTIIAVAGGIRTRMAIHSHEVELLHLIGATDTYIARQFQNHAMILALQGGLIGTGAGLVSVLAIVLFSGNSGTSLIPSLQIGIGSFLILACVPFATLAIAGITARFTVLRTLADMP